jgi:hypothetical protein
METPYLLLKRVAQGAGTYSWAGRSALLRMVAELLLAAVRSEFGQSSRSGCPRGQGDV